MAERPEDRRHARPIVPDPDSSLAPTRLRHPPPPRVWPLWLLVLLLAAAAIALAWAGWQERARLQGEIARLGGEVSNVHARFDAQEGSGETLATLEARLGALEDSDQAIGGRIVELQEDTGARFKAMDERLDDLSRRLEEVSEAGETREALLASIRVSLDALERAGDEGRSALGERIATLADTQQRNARRLEALEAEAEEGEAQAISLGELEERLTRDERRLEAIAARQEGLVDELDAVASSRDDDRLQALEAELNELRRTQLALSARLEVLQR